MQKVGPKAIVNSKSLNRGRDQDPMKTRSRPAGSFNPCGHLIPAMIILLHPFNRHGKAEKPAPAGIKNVCRTLVSMWDHVPLRTRLGAFKKLLELICGQKLRHF